MPRIFNSSIFVLIVAVTVACGAPAAYAQSPGPAAARPSEYHSPVSDAQLKAVALKIKGSRAASGALVEAFQRDDKAAVGNILKSNGAGPPRGAVIELAKGPITIKPDDVCFEVTRTIQEINGKIVETWRVRMYACS